MILYCFLIYFWIGLGIKTKIFSISMLVWIRWVTYLVYSLDVQNRSQ